MLETGINEALASVRGMLEADDYSLDVRVASPSAIVAEIRAGPDACPTCLVPKPMMALQFEKALDRAGITDITAIELIYPVELG